MDEKLIKVIRILGNRTDKRIKMAQKREMPDNSFIILLRNEETNIIGRLRNAGKMFYTADDLIAYANEKDAKFDNDMS
jgi:hypothetical protein